MSTEVDTRADAHVDVDALADPAESRPIPDADMVTHLRLGAGGLDAFLNAVEDRRRPLIKYRDGGLTLVSPSRRHEHGANRLDDVIKAVCDGLGIDSEETGSTLFRKRGVDAGIEADRSHYFASAPALSGVEGDIDLDLSPPPDLVVEVVVAHPAAKSLAVCRALGVPEVWVYQVRSGTLAFLHLSPGRDRYAAASSSRSFPFLAPGDVLPWLVAGADEPPRRWRERLRLWVRDTLAPRREGQAGGGMRRGVEVGAEGDTPPGR